MRDSAAARREAEEIRRRLRERGGAAGAVERTARGAARGRLGARDLAPALAVARELWGSRRPDERALAVHYLAQFHRRFQAASWGEFKRWLAEARSTAELDLVATRLTGTLVQKDRAWCRVLGNWALSRSARERRAAAMALVPRARRMGDAEAALALCEGLMRDRSPLVREGVEALLREARAADPALAADFLSRWNRSAGW